MDRGSFCECPSSALDQTPLEVDTRKMTLYPLCATRNFERGTGIHIGKERVENHNVPPKILNNVDRLSAKLQNAFGISFFGYDLILATKNKDLWIVDINYFPSYKFESNMGENLMNHILKKYKKSRSNTITSSTQNINLHAQNSCTAR
jgi:hypothetical protein